jgi:peroxiredoxin family protein
MATRARMLGEPPATPAAELENRLKLLEEKIVALEARVPEDRVCLVVFSGELDRVLQAFVIASGAAALGQQVSMFFTFWGLAGLRRKRLVSGKRFSEKLMTLLSPASNSRLPMSRLNFFGVGSRVMRRMMKDKHVASLEELMRIARRMGARIVACETSRDVMGIRDEELMDDLEFGGTASFLSDALRSRVTLFI